MDPPLAELLGRYQTVATGYLTARVRDPEAASDLYQSVVRALLESGREFASAEHLRNYFFVALRNAAHDLLRTKRRSREVRLPDDPSLLAAPASESPPERLIAEEELERTRRRAAALRAALAALPEAERELLRQRFWERRTFREIREATGTPISTLKSREDAILKKLKKLVGNPAADA
jgi:RNA polymerase sigma-70 factor (ECF subfamily)